jgi:calcium-dependent protein kinase
MSLSTHYTIKYSELMGSGASGKVYFATRKSDNLPMAVKIIARNALNRELLVSISNEIKALNILNHPHIVRLYDMFDDQRHFYLVSSSYITNHLVNHLQ